MSTQFAKLKMMNTKPAKIYIAEKALPLPCFFPSVSSVKTNLAPRVYIELISSSSHPLFLISAYDMAAASKCDFVRIQAALDKSMANGATILMDSGNYEKYWKYDAAWTVNKFHKIRSSCKHHIGFCYDNLEPSKKVNVETDEVVRSVLRDQVGALASVAPIVHGMPSTIDKVAKNVAKKLRPLMLAVPERDLGDGILARTQTVKRIRTALNGLDFYCPLHLLGTGNPLSIAIYSMAGADSFDGLEWCQTVVDHDTGKLSHFQQWDLFRHQTSWGENGGLPYDTCVLLHNLEFFKYFMQTLCEDTNFKFCKEFVKKSVSGRQSTLLFNAANGRSAMKSAKRG